MQESQGINKNINDIDSSIDADTEVSVESPNLPDKKISYSNSVSSELDQTEFELIAQQEKLLLLERAFKSRVRLAKLADKIMLFVGALIFSVFYGGVFLDEKAIIIALSSIPSTLRLTFSVLAVILFLFISWIYFGKVRYFLLKQSIEDEIELLKARKSILEKRESMFDKRKLIKEFIQPGILEDAELVQSGTNGTDSSYIQGDTSISLPSLFGEASEVSYFNTLVDINLKNLEAYYKIVKEHTNKSFQISAAAGILGFILIFTGLAIGLFSESADRSRELVAYTSAGCGIFIEFISGVFFYLYNRTIRQLKEYHDSLLSVQNILLAFKMLGDIKTDEIKAGMIKDMMSFLLGNKDLVNKSLQTK